MSENYYRVGNIVNTHGIRGEVRVLAVTDAPQERFKPQARLYVVTAGTYQPLTVTSYRRHKNFDLVAFAEIPDLTAAEKLKGKSLWVAADDRRTLQVGEGYYYHQIIGLKVVDHASATILGTVKEILQPGANDVWVVARPGKKDWLLPAIKQVILKIDLSQQQVLIDLPEGLIDDAD